MNRIATFTWLAAGLLACGWARGGDTTQPAGPADMLASDILHKANIRVGVCEMPRIGDGTLAVALARQDVSILQGLAANAEVAATARKPAEDAHVFGSQVIVETGSPAAIPLQDWVADLLVVADATDANLQEIPPSEVKRVLAPYRGVAVVGQPKAGPGGLTVAGLTAWAKQLDGTADVKQDDTGLWAVVKMPPLAGGDDWSHYYHGPDGNPVSKDVFLKGTQFGLQWIGGPYWAGKFDVHVAAAGREFHAQSTIYWRHGGLPFIIRARSLYNGEVLWKRKIDPDFGDIGSLMVATPDRLYIKDGSGALALNAETGDELLRFGDKDNGGDCKWIMLSDGVLVTMNGPKRTAEWGVGKGTGKSFDDQQNYENETFYASDMDGWDAATGKNIWQFKADRIDPTETVIREGRIYFYANYAYAECMDLKTGQQIWKTPAPIEEPKGPGMGLGWALNSIMTPRQSAMTTDKVYLINSHAHLQSAAFALADGTLLWQKLKGKTSSDNKKTAADADAGLLYYPVFLNGRLYDRQWRWSGWEQLTGKPIGGHTLFDYSGCGHFTATESGLVFGQCGGVLDTSNHHLEVTDTYSKAACGVSQFPADGVLVKAPADCPACTEWRGFIVDRNGTDDQPQGVRFEKGPAFDATPSSTTSDASDWPTYRSTTDRSASSAAAMPAGGAILWTYQMAPARKLIDRFGWDYSDLPRTQISPPIAVGDRVFLGTADGTVLCLDRATGQVQWQYWTAGQIMSAPTWAGGRLYVGSADGWIYCLAADTGQLAWRYRLAPVDRQTMVFGRLSSQWPILANVLVQDGVVYAAAGLIDTLGGSSICALDAQSGQMKWEQDLTGSKDRTAPSAAGQLAYYHGEIWWHVANGGLRVLDAATGKMATAPDLMAMGLTPSQLSSTLFQSFNPSHGLDIGVLPGGWVGLSGNEFFLPGNIAEEPRDQPMFMRTSDGVPQLEAFSLTKAAVRPCLPAWDSKEVLVGGGEWMYGSKARPIPPTLWNNFAASLEDVAAAHPTKMPAPNHGITLPRDLPIVPSANHSKPAMPLAIGAAANIHWYSPTLATNAAIMIAYREPEWDVYAFGRADQTMLTKVKLPQKPETNGLALTRTGDVLVSMVDGNLICIGPKQAPSTQPGQ